MYPNFFFKKKNKEKKVEESVHEVLSSAAEDWQKRHQICNVLEITFLLDVENPR